MKTLPRILASLAIASALVFVPGCEDDDHGNDTPASAATQSSGDAAAQENGKSADPQAVENSSTRNDVAIGEGNDRNLVVCIGDSITQGYACEGAPWPSILAGKTGKSVVNMGSGGAKSSAAPGAARSAVAKNPAYVCILYGSNDAIHGVGASSVAANLRSAIAICKEAGVRPVIGTPPPMRDSHSLYDGNAKAIAGAIRSLASEQGVSCVDLYGAFGNGSGLLVSDGLHPNAAGANLIASKFAGRL